MPRRGLQVHDTKSRIQKCRTEDKKPEVQLDQDQDQGPDQIQFPFNKQILLLPLCLWSLVFVFCYLPSGILEFVTSYHGPVPKKSGCLAAASSLPKEQWSEEEI
jgi:hypothetical protein